MESKLDNKPLQEEEDSIEVIDNGRHYPDMPEQESAAFMSKNGDVENQPYEMANEDSVEQLMLDMSVQRTQNDAIIELE